MRNIREGGRMEEDVGGPESGICGEDRATSNVDGVRGLSWVEKCRGIALASLGPPPPVGCQRSRYRLPYGT